MLKVIYLNPDIIKVQSDQIFYLGEIVHIKCNNLKALSRVISYNKQNLLLQPLSPLPSFNSESIELIPTKNQLQVNLSPTILGRKFSSMGVPIDGLEEILEIETVSVDLCNNKINFKNSLDLSFESFLDKLKNNDSENLALIVVGYSNFFKEIVFNTHSWSNMSVQYEVTGFWNDWLIATEQAIIVAKYIEKELNFESIIIIDGWQNYLSSVDKQAQIYSNLFPTKANINHPIINVNKDFSTSKISLWKIHY
jgi:hypothetical protein